MMRKDTGEETGKWADKIWTFPPLMNGSSGFTLYLLRRMPLHSVMRKKGLFVLLKQFYFFTFTG